MKLVLVFLLTFSIVLANDNNDLEQVRKKIELQNNGFMAGDLITSMEDDWFNSLIYYKQGGYFKELLKLKERAEIIHKFGDRRRWFVSKWQGKEPAVYVSASYNEDSTLSKNKQSTDLKDDYLFYFKNYCEFDGTIDVRYAKIKKCV
ncbi:hypothetical protein LPTSP2_36150 [Leptospira ellinghausenii]|uniref:Uncharacterized protein n=1 Tax=Leptospira ellinghausenii TaxID=1917822 RepID=A0A2P2DI46_9LEPT|nr:hypothetical protein [Leptospira ellinghausenii]GBF44312.1 hypothetical protein LPTSP2_36150 [Leptospira ellinghausenii]